MLVLISDRELDAPRLCMAEELGSLSVRAETDTTDWDALAWSLAVARAGEVAGGHAWLDISWLREAAGERDARWEGGFEGMVAHAGEYGWLSADGNRVRAHVDWGPAHVD
jgi:hypothetical protein